MTTPGAAFCPDPGSSAETVAWHDAPARVRGLIERAGRHAEAVGRGVLVGIGGPVASGKSTLARALSPCVVATDDYLPDYDRVPIHERDEPRHADYRRLAADLAALREGRSARVPVWSFKSHRREGEREVAPARIVVCEGIHALFDEVAPLLDVAVFVDAPRAVRLERWRAREQAGDRGWSVEYATEFFHGVAEPTFERYAAAYRARAHVIVEAVGARQAERG
jgi:uridine kinase